MSTDIQLEQVVPREQTLATIAATVGVEGCNYPYGVGTIFGERVEDGTETTPAICDGIRVALDRLMTHKTIGGSAASVGEFDDQMPRLDQSPLLNALRELRTEVLPKFYNGETTLATMSSDEYAMLKLLVSLQGPNFEIIGFDNRNDLRDTFQQAVDLFRFSYTFPYDGWSREINIVDYFGRFKIIHFSEVTGQAGGINVAIFPYSKNPDDEWSRVTNWRQYQTRIVGQNAEGKIVAYPQGEAEPIDSIQLLAQLKTQGEWEHHLARTIRSMVIHDVADDQLDVSSFTSKIPQNSEINFEAYIGVVSNLMVAFCHNPEKTMRLLESTTLQQYLPNFDETRAQAMTEQYKLSHYHTHHLMEDVILTQHDLREFRSIFSPITDEMVPGCMPDGDHRETVERIRAGSNALNADPYDTIPMNAIYVFESLAAELEQQDDSESQEQRTILLRAAAAVRKQFIRKKVVVPPRETLHMMAARPWKPSPFVEIVQNQN